MQRYMDLLVETLKKMREHNRWFVLIHENPDGDTLGCGLAVYSLGLRQGKEVRVMGKSAMPESYSFLPFSERYEQTQALTAADVSGDALVICVDTSTEERSVGGLSLLVDKRNSLNIDHHGDNKLYAGLNVVAPEASATAEIIMDIFEQSGLQLNRDEAVCLYTALVTDNGNFRFKSTTPRSHLCAAKLLETGIDPSELDDRINRNMTEGTMRLWGDAFCRIEIFADGNAAIFWLSFSDFRRAGADFTATDGLVNLLMRIKGVNVAILLTELEDGVKLSVRTRGSFSAREIAAEWGGGGHIQAAGAKINADIAQAMRTVKDRVGKYVTNRNTAVK